MITQGQHSARQINHANILLKAAAGWTDTATAQAFGVCERTVKRVRRPFIEEGLEATLNEKPRSGRPVEYGAGEQALIIATACTPAPQGYERWSVRLLSWRLAELGVEGISRETVRRTLKKGITTPAQKAVVYPLVCVDEKGKELSDTPAGNCRCNSTNRPGGITNGNGRAVAIYS